MCTNTDTVLLSNIRRLLDEKGIKHCKVAAACGLSAQEFSRLLSGKRVVKTIYIPQIANILGCSYNDLFAANETKAG